MWKRLSMVVKSSVIVFTLLACLSFTARAAVYPYIAPNALFGFTDSLSDTGNQAIAWPGHSPACFPPYGNELNAVTGRWCNGLLIIDYLNKYFVGELERPSLSYYGSDYMSLGFGSGGSTVLPQPYPGLNLDILPSQVAQFRNYKAAVIKANSSAAKLFSDALYYIEIGGNDINFALRLGSLSFKEVTEKVIPGVVQGLVDSIANLHVSGSGVHFLIFNMPAAGCSPFYLTNYPDAKRDAIGCIAEANKMVQFFNKRINRAVERLRCEYPSANFMTFDFYQASIFLVAESNNVGFTKTTTACCGVGLGPGTKYNCKGGPDCGCAVDVEPCHDPDSYVSWDGVHYTQQFYKFVAQMILDGAYLDPPTPFSKSSNKLGADHMASLR